jgi:hypothetical protein
VRDLHGGGHRKELCQGGWERKCQHAAAARSQQALEHSFTCDGEGLERVKVFKYLGQLIGYNDADTQAMRSTLRKVQGYWAWILPVLWAEYTSPQTCGMFYKVTVQAVLLYRSEMWSLLPSSVKRLEGFHVSTAWQMSSLWPEKKSNSMWSYPCSADVLEKARLQMTAHYISVRQQTVANFIVN